MRTAEAEIQAGRLSAFDLLIVPGGSGSKQASNLGESGREQIRDFVRNGKGYVGICAGSYLASSDYEWSLHLLNAKVFDRAHWARGTGTVELKFSSQGKELLGETADKFQVYYGQGPLLVPDTKPDLPAFEPLAEYASEIAEKGAPKGVMIGTTAIARGDYGQGRVICFSPHPEGNRKTEHIMLAGVRWASGKEPVLLSAKAETKSKAESKAESEVPASATP
ncbi:MAG: BPL-N domain-containing protein [Pirellulales bacterium]